MPMTVFNLLSKHNSAQDSIDRGGRPMTTITAPQSQALWMLNSLMVERVTADQTERRLLDARAVGHRRRQPAAAHAHARG